MKPPFHTKTTKQTHTCTSKHPSGQCSCSLRVGSDTQVGAVQSAAFFPRRKRRSVTHIHMQVPWSFVSAYNLHALR